MEMEFKKFIEGKFVQWQSEQGKRKTVADFAAYLGISQPLLSMWMNGSKKPGIENIKILSQIYGLEIYDLLGKPRPDASFFKMTTYWNFLNDSEREAISKQVEVLARKRKPKSIHPVP